MIRLFPRTLRLRITLLFTIVFGIISGGAGMITYLHLHDNLYERIDRDLFEKMKQVNKLISQSRLDIEAWESINSRIHEETESSNFIHFVQIVRTADRGLIVNSRKDQRDFTHRMDESAENPCNVEANNIHFRVYRYKDHDYEIYVASPIDIVVHTFNVIQATYFIFLPLALLIASISVFIIIQRSLKPITIATRTAESITSTNLEERLPPPVLDDEVGELVNTLNHMIARLEDAFNQITQFMADAAHELHTPLTILRGELEVALRRHDLEKNSVRLLQSNLDEVNRLINIVESLFTLARIDAKQLPIEFAPVELDVLLHELYNKALVLAEPKNISVQLARNDAVVVNGDTYRLIQLFLNLINNAIRYTPEGGTITLSSENLQSRARVRVSDTGIGIPQSELEKIFNRFYRVDKARSREMGGSGLGLSIARRVVDLHHGSISVQSEEGKGSTFEVILPMNKNV